MRHPVRRLLARAVPWIVITALLPLACGRRGAPIPPRRVAPAAVESVRAGPRDRAGAVGGQDRLEPRAGRRADKLAAHLREHARDGLGVLLLYRLTGADDRAGVNG